MRHSGRRVTKSFPLQSSGANQHIEENQEMSRKEAYQLLAGIGVPFGPDGEPIGIWDD